MGGKHGGECPSRATAIGAGADKESHIERAKHKKCGTEMRNDFSLYISLWGAYRYPTKALSFPVDNLRLTG